ncbi:MAG: hypothetical protein ABI960_01590 [Candidatus Eisenbacteria bacterium]
MQLIGNLSESIVALMIFAVPIVAIIGGITAGIVKTMSQGRVIENAQRERIAAIQAGIDPARLPPVPSLGDLGAGAENLENPELAARRLSQGLMIGGTVTLFAGIGLGLFLWLVNEDGRAWAVGLMPGFVGVALLISSFLVRPPSRA